MNFVVTADTLPMRTIVMVQNQTTTVTRKKIITKITKIIMMTVMIMTMMMTVEMTMVQIVISLEA